LQKFTLDLQGGKEDIGIYLWWIIDKHEQAFAGVGDGGNVIYINQKKDLVISIMSLFDSKIDIQKERIELIKNHIEPMVTLMMV